MLLKIFKHDFKTCARYEVPILFAILGATVLGVLDVFLISLAVKNYTIDETLTAIGATIGMLGFTFIGTVLTAAAFVMLFMLYYRFYKSMITDEAYLTLTLPVKPHTLLTGKLLSALAWYFISMVAIIAVIAVIVASAGIMFSAEIHEFFEFFHDVGEFFIEAIEFFEFNVGTVILIAVTTVVGAVSGLLQIFFSILFAGSIVKKYKALCAVGMVLGINFVVSSISQTILQVINIGSEFLLDLSSLGQFLNIQLGVQLVLQIVLGVVFYILSCHLIKHKVNLE